MQSPYHYDLPRAKIANRPIHPYDAAKLLVLDPTSEELSDTHFRDLPLCLPPDSVLVFNNTKVLPCRFFVRFGVETEPADREIFLIEELRSGVWKAMGRPLKKFRPGVRLTVNGKERFEVVERSGEKEIIIQVIGETETLWQEGTMPIPPYIRKGVGDEQDREDYQTHFAVNPGSVAAPTASLHFTEELRRNLAHRGISELFVTLHVGTSSILPVLQDGEIREPGAEYFQCDEEILDAVLKFKREGRPIVAVGTTVVRALESLARLSKEELDGTLRATKLFITPGFEFKIIDGLITNFHQPGTTHLLLVEAFTGRKFLESAYSRALSEPYRFLSYGDGMIILPRNVSS